MSEPVYRLGEAVKTPYHGDGIIVTVNRGAIRGRHWREVSYTIKPAGTRRAVVYYESEISRIPSAG